jgi:hypothetical protein
MATMVFNNSVVTKLSKKLQKVIKKNVKGQNKVTVFIIGQVFNNYSEKKKTKTSRLDNIILVLTILSLLVGILSMACNWACRNALGMQLSMQENIGEIILQKISFELKKNFNPSQAQISREENNNLRI